MSDSIHLDSEQALQTAALLVQTNEQMEARLHDLAGAVKALPWEGPGRQAFVAEFSRLIERLSQLSEEGRTLGLRLQREVDEWLAVDDTGGRNFKNLITTLGIFAVEFGMVIQDLWWGLQYADFKTWWTKLTDQEKLDYLNEQEQKIAERLGFPPVKITTEDIADPDGQDVRGENRDSGIVIDQENLTGDDPWRLVETIAHESRHQFQRYAVEQYKTTGKVPEHATEAQVKAWSENFDSYQEGKNDFEAYWTQPIEQDARSFGGSYMQEILDNKGWG